MTNCTSTTSATGAALTAEVFCMNFIPNCTGKPSVPTNLTASMSSCMTAFDALPNKSCSSYHLCWGVEGQGASPPAGGANPTTHCMHAGGAAPCNQ
jgi:hypothetical protein